MPGMDRRLITPFDESPHISDLESLEVKYEGLELSEIIEPIVTPREDIAGGKKTAKKSKRNRTRTKSGGGTLEKIFICSFKLPSGDLFHNWAMCSQRQISRVFNTALKKVG